MSRYLDLLTDELNELNEKRVVKEDKPDLNSFNSFNSYPRNLEEVLRAESVSEAPDAKEEAEGVLLPFADLIARVEANTLPIPSEPYYPGPPNYPIHDPNLYVRCAAADVHRLFKEWKAYPWREKELQEKIEYLTFLREQIITNPEELSQA